MIFQQKNRPCKGYSCAAPRRPSLSSMIFCTKKGAVVKNTGREKVRILSEEVESVYVNSGCIICFHSPVEKAVENVEKYEFSTAISPF